MIRSADRGPAPNNQHRYFARLQAPQQSTNDQATVHDVNILALPGWISTYRALVPAQEQELTYDLDGNLASDGLWTYRYDAENRLTRMRMHLHLADWLLNKSGQTDPAWLELRFMYDHQHRRVGKMVLTSQQHPMDVKDDTDAEYTFSTSYSEKYLYDTGTFNLLMSFRADPQTGQYVSPGRSYHWGPDLSGTLTGAGGIGGLAMTQDLAHDAVNALDPIGPMFAVYDGHGNLTRLYDSTRTPMAAYEYAPFGEVRSVAGEGGQGAANPFRFSTKFADAETGLSYYGYRFYSAQMGRWVNRDPIGERDHFNLRAFVQNSPTAQVDPLGLWTIGANFSGTPWTSYSGTVVADCGDSLEELAWAITGEGWTWTLLGVEKSVQWQQVVDVSPLLDYLSEALRLNTVSQTKSFKGRFGASSDPPPGPGQPVRTFFRPGASSERSLRAFASGQLLNTVTDCSNGAETVFYLGLADQLNRSGVRGEFDRSFRSNRSRFLQQKTITREQDLLHGDWTEVANVTGYRALFQGRRVDAWQAENVIYQGAGLYWGHGLTPQAGNWSLNGIEEKLFQRALAVWSELGPTAIHKPLRSDIVGLRGQQARFWDAAKIATNTLETRLGRR